MIILIEYAKCSTCAKARKWLDEQQIKYERRSIIEQCPTEQELEQWNEQSGLSLKRFFNTSGLIYKNEKLKERLPTLSQEEQYQLLATNGMLIKRPILVGDTFILLGFKEAEWRKELMQ